jgi:hypothetical protein
MELFPVPKVICTDCQKVELDIPDRIYQACLRNEKGIEGLDDYCYLPDIVDSNEMEFLCGPCIDHAGYRDYMSGAGDY